MLDNQQQLEDLDSVSSQFIKLFRKHVKKKKTHEIEQMAQVIILYKIININKIYIQRV